MTSLGMMSGFLVIPNLAAFVQGNMGFPRSKMGELYLVGGLLSLVSMRFSGAMVDRFGSARVGTIATAFIAILLWLFFYQQMPGVSALALFMTFMPILSMRNVSFQTLNSKVPDPEERSMYMSALSSVNHIGSASGAFLASQLLSEGSGGALIGMPLVALISIGCGLLLVPLLWSVEGRIRTRVENRVDDKFNLSKK